MRKTAGLQLVFLLAGMADAQDRHFPQALGAGLPPVHPTAPRNAPPVTPLHHPFPVIGAGLAWGGYAAGYPEPGPVVNNFLMVEQSGSAPAPAQPSEPIHSSIQDLKPPASDAPPAYFVIALKNGSRLAAAAVWIQGNDLRYVDADDQNRRVPLSDVDRAATREINQARNLNLRLPPPTQ
jgi:hypothetical protein